MTDTTLETPHGEMPMYVASPAGGGKHAGVVVIHDAFGMSHDLRNHADWLAGEGYLAAAPNLFYWGGRIACIRAVFRAMTERKGRYFDEIDAVRSWLTSQPGCTGKIGVIGYCMGGGFALLLAPGHGYSASSVNYGRIPGDVDSILEGACPIIGSYGAKDRGLRGAASKLEQACEHAKVPHDIKEYPGAGHSFLNDHEPSDIPVLMRVMLRLGGAGFHEPSATDAKKRIAAFFKEHLAS